MARIVLDARKFDAGSGTGAGRYMSSLVQYLQSIDSANQYIILMHEDNAQNWTPSSNNFSVVVTKYKEFTLGEQLGLAWQLYKLKADIVHFGMVQQPILYFKRSLCTIHDLTTVRFRNTNKSAIKFYLMLPAYWLVIQVAGRKSKLIITPTQYVKRDVAAFTRISEDKIVVTPESADEFKETTQPSSELLGKTFLLYVGRPQPHKNLTSLIKAFGALKKKHPSLKLVLAGKKDILHEAHLETAKKVGIAYEDIVFTGYVTDGQLRWLYQNCAAYVFPSLSEGFGLPGLEAMLHGAPVVSSNSTCLPEVYGDAAEYFDPNNALEMTKKIDLVISDTDLHKKLIAKGYRRAKQFSWHRMAEQTLRAYEEALGA